MESTKQDDIEIVKEDIDEIKSRATYDSLRSFLDSRERVAWVKMDLGGISVVGYFRKGRRHRDGVTYETFDIANIACYPFNKGGFKKFLSLVEETTDRTIYVEAIHSAVLAECLPRYGFVVDPLDEISMFKFR